MNSRRNLYIFLTLVGFIIAVFVLANSDDERLSFDITSTLSRRSETENYENPYIPIDTEKNNIFMPDSAKYRSYSLSDFEKNKDKIKVLFFYAPWCSDCRDVDTQILNGQDSVPDNIVIYKINYDEEEDLKAKYGITSHHTFIIIDQKDNVLHKWVGGSLREILEKI